MNYTRINHESYYFLTRYSFGFMKMCLVNYIGNVYSSDGCFGREHPGRGLLVKLANLRKCEYYTFCSTEKQKNSHKSLRMNPIFF
jgi:hypothetical protein